MPYDPERHGPQRITGPGFHARVHALVSGVPAGATASFGEGQGIFASSKGTFRILFVKARPDIANYRECIHWLTAIKGAVQAARGRGEIASDVAVGFTGGPAFAAEISSGMEHDMTSSIGITSAIIAVLFWIFHRRWVPMLWLLALLAVILACTLALGGLLQRGGWSSALTPSSPKAPASSGDLKKPAAPQGAGGGH